MSRVPSAGVRERAAGRPVDWGRRGAPVPCREVLGDATGRALLRLGGGLGGSARGRRVRSGQGLLVIPGHPFARCFTHRLRMAKQRHEVVEGIALTQLHGVDEAHEDVAHVSALERPVEEGVLAVEVSVRRTTCCGALRSGPPLAAGGDVLEHHAGSEALRRAGLGEEDSLADAALPQVPEELVRGVAVREEDNAPGTPRVRRSGHGRESPGARARGIRAKAGTR